MLAPPRQPIDPTLGELPVDQLRPLVRTIADTVGKRVARKVQESLSAGRAAVGRRREGRLGHRDPSRAGRLQRGTRPRRARSTVGPHPPSGARRRDGPRLRPRRARRAVGQRRRREHRCQRAATRCSSTFVGGERVRWTPVAADQDELIELIRRAARQLGANEVEFDARHPQLDRAAARWLSTVRRVRRRRRQRRGDRAAAVDPPAPLPRRVDGRPRRARRAAGGGRSSSSSPPSAPVRT